jgi:hypothetical protein
MWTLQMIKLFIVQFPASFQSCTKQCLYIFFVLLMAEPWPLRLVAGRSRRRSGFDSHPMCVRACACARVVAVGKGAVGQVSLYVLLFSPVSITPPMLHTQFYLNPALIWRTSGRWLGTFKQNLLCREHWIQKYFYVVICTSGGGQDISAALCRATQTEQEEFMVWELRLESWGTGCDGVRSANEMTDCVVRFLVPGASNHNGRPSQNSWT